MKKVIIEYNQYIIKVHLTEDNTSIIDSYRVKSISDMINVLKEIRKICDESYAYTREVYSAWSMNGEHITCCTLYT